MHYKPLHVPQPAGVVLPFNALALVTVSLPLGAFLFCVIWSLMFNFTASTSTHCNVINYLPSISAAIGNFTPQKYVWRVAIALHSAPRYLVAFLYYHFKHRSCLLFILNIAEISSLVGLTFISSNENYPIHAHCFVLFMLSALLNMFVAVYTNALTRVHRTSPAKKYLAWVNLSSGALSVYFYTRHNWYCEPGVYTLFALAEYIIVITNICFHFQAYFDFSDVTFHIKSIDFQVLNP